ncbi:MAG: DUF2313 domain-containing protein [Lachnospiraceae bacterium]|nr:DUF2313 domain-containing protein [Lachnospiraceae bacterium]
MFEYPEVLKSTKEFPAIYNMNDKINPAKDAENLEQDLFIGTATLDGIGRREKEYGIVPKDTDDVEDRRFRIMEKENGRLPYTIRTLRKKLETLCGENGFYLKAEQEKITVKIALGRKAMFETVCKMLDEIIPLNLLIDATILFNTYEMMSGKTHGELANRTYEQIRTEVFK